MRLYKCFMCGAIVSHFDYRYDSSSDGEDEAVCPVCQAVEPGFSEVLVDESLQNVNT